VPGEVEVLELGWRAPQSVEGLAGKQVAVAPVRGHPGVAECAHEQQHDDYYRQKGLLTLLPHLGAMVCSQGQWVMWVAAKKVIAGIYMVGLQARWR